MYNFGQMNNSMISLASENGEELRDKDLTFKKFAHKTSGFKTAIGSLRNS